MKSNALVPALDGPFAPSARPAAPRVAPPPLDADAALRRTLLARLASQPWWDADHANVFVDRGTVVYQGLLPTSKDAAARRAAREVALAVPGVRDVWDARVPRREWQRMS